MGLRELLSRRNLKAVLAHAKSLLGCGKGFRQSRLKPLPQVGASEVEIDLGPERAAWLVDAGFGGETKACVAGQVEVLGVVLVEQVIHTGAELDLLADALGAVEREHAETGAVAEAAIESAILRIQPAELQPSHLHMTDRTGHCREQDAEIQQPGNQWTMVASRFHGTQP